MNSDLSKRWHLRLYVSGDNSKSKRAIRMLKQVCDEHLKNDFKMEVIDILKHPEFGSKDNIIVTPAILRRLPYPVRRIVGEIVDKEKLLAGLDIADAPKK